jgi:hypothetical protein
MSIKVEYSEGAGDFVYKDLDEAKAHNIGLREALVL